MWRFYLIAVALVLGLCLMNFARVGRKNMPVKSAESIETQTKMPPNAAAIFRRACKDCHTELTYWPWYANIAPFQWLVTGDVYGAREHMNLSKWGRYTEEEQMDRLIDICEMVASNKMPPWYYKPVHYPAAWLSNADKKTVCDWAKTEVGRIAAR
jgi:hypothetical protein